MRYLTSSHKDLMMTLIRTRFTAADKEDIMKNAITHLIWYEEDYNARNSKIFEELSNLPHMRNNAGIIEQLSSADPRLTFLIANVKFHKLNLPDEYLQPLKPHLECKWDKFTFYGKTDRGLTGVLISMDIWPYLFWKQSRYILLYIAIN